MLVNSEKGTGMSMYDVMAYLGILVVILACMSAYSRAREVLRCTFGHRHPKIEEAHIEAHHAPAMDA